MTPEEIRELGRRQARGEDIRPQQPEPERPSQNEVTVGDFLLVCGLMGSLWESSARRHDGYPTTREEPS